MSAQFTSAWYEAYQARQYARGLAPAPKVTRGEELEKDLQADIEAFLKSLGRDCKVRRSAMHKPTTGTVGEPDFIGSYKGRPFVIEVKRPGQKVRPEQAGELMLWELAGAKTLVAYSVEDVITFVGTLTPEL